jgi:hypothetical protein
MKNHEFRSVKTSTPIYLNCNKNLSGFNLFKKRNPLARTNISERIFSPYLDLDPGPGPGPTKERGTHDLRCCDNRPLVLETGLINPGFKAA